jgi:hypothetical protein
MDTNLKHHFVAYDDEGTVIASAQVKRGTTLEDFALAYPANDVAEVVITIVKCAPLKRREYTLKCGLV